MGVPGSLPCAVVSAPPNEQGTKCHSSVPPNPDPTERRRKESQKPKCHLAPDGGYSHRSVLHPLWHEMNITKFKAVLDQGKSWVVGTSVPLEEQENKALCRQTAPKKGS